MGFVAKNSGGSNFEPAPSGLHVARCYQLIDIGTQKSDGQYGAKDQHKIRIGFELFAEDDEGRPIVKMVNDKPMPLTIGKTYTLSLREKSGLRRDLSAWRGRAFTDDEANGFDVSRLLGAYAYVNITHTERDGKVFANIASIAPLPGSMKNNKPAPVHQNQLFDLDNRDMTVFAALSPKMQEFIMGSKEWNQKPPPSNDGRSEDEEVPF